MRPMMSSSTPHSAEMPSRGSVLMVGWLTSAILATFAALNIQFWGFHCHIIANDLRQAMDVVQQCGFGLPCPRMALTIWTIRRVGPSTGNIALRNLRSLSEPASGGQIFENQLW